MTDPAGGTAGASESLSVERSVLQNLGEELLGAFGVR